MPLKENSISYLGRILGAGGGVRFVAKSYTTDELTPLATQTKSGGGRLILMGMSARNTDDLMRIAAAGGGHVIFED